MTGTVILKQGAGRSLCLRLWRDQKVGPAGTPSQGLKPCDSNTPSGPGTDGSSFQFTHSLVCPDSLQRGQEGCLRMVSIMNVIVDEDKRNISFSWSAPEQPEVRRCRAVTWPTDSRFSPFLVQSPRLVPGRVWKRGRERRSSPVFGISLQLFREGMACYS